MLKLTIRSSRSSRSTCNQLDQLIITMKSRLRAIERTQLTLRRKQKKLSSRNNNQRKKLKRQQLQPHKQKLLLNPNLKKLQEVTVKARVMLVEVRIVKVKKMTMMKNQTLNQTMMGKKMMLMMTMTIMKFMISLKFQENK